MTTRERHKDTKSFMTLRVFPRSLEDGSFFGIFHHLAVHFNHVADDDAFYPTVKAHCATAGRSDPLSTTVPVSLIA